MIDPAFWHGRRVLVTGHTGFIGSWLCLSLQELNAEVFGYALGPPTHPSLFDEARVRDRLSGESLCDVCEGQLLREFVARAQPTIVFHLAAQPLVSRGYREPSETWNTNVLGTVHLLEAVRANTAVQVVQIFTSDKCYENRETGRPFAEDDPLGGSDPYSSSKAAAELVVAAWRNSFFDTDSTVSLATVRAGNVIGGGDWAEDRLVPDCIRAFETQQRVTLRSPTAIRPWQHVLDAVSALLHLAQAQSAAPKRFSQAFNVGPVSSEPVSVGEIVELVQSLWHRQLEGEKPLIVPGLVGHEAHHLTLDIRKFTEMLGWRPRRTLLQTVQETVNWYRHRYEQGSQFHALQECRSAIAAEFGTIAS